MHAANLDLPPHVVRMTEEVDLFLLSYARAKIAEMDEQAQKFAPALDVEFVEEDEDEGLWC